MRRLFSSLEIAPYPDDAFLADLNKMTQGRMDQALATTLVRESNAAVHWMKGIGIKWELLKEHAKVGKKRYFERGIAIHVAGGGVGQLEQWRAIAERMGIEIRFRSPVNALHGNQHRVNGVRVCSADGEYDLEARAVIACAGGFQASAEMRARYLSGNADYVKVRGSKHDTGEVINYLLALGASTGGQWQSGHMSPIDANAPNFETPQHADGRGNTQSRYDYPFGISVNALGQRFFDEGEAQHSFTYAKTGRAVLAQPGAAAWQIYDQKGIRLHRYPHHKASFEEADTIAGLAQKIGLAPEVLTDTITRFNAACRGRHGVRSDTARRKGDPGARYTEVELGRAHRRAAVSGVSCDLRHHVHLWRRTSESEGAGAQYVRRTDQGPLCVWRHSRTFLSQLPVFHGTDA